jgi:hypothetical protein
MYNGGLIGFVSGGVLTRGGGRQNRRAERDERRMFQYEQRLQSGRRLGPKRQRRYERYSAAREMYGSGRRSFDGRDNAPAPYAPYGGQSGSSSAYAPYGGSTSTHAPYGGQSGSSQPYPPRVATRRQGGALSIVKRVMTEDVLYLMIVPMPSEQELAEAREALAQAQKDH